MNPWPDTHLKGGLPRNANLRQRETNANRPYMHYRAILAECPRGDHSGRPPPQGQYYIYIYIYIFFWFFLCFVYFYVLCSDQMRCPKCVLTDMFTIGSDQISCLKCLLTDVFKMCSDQMIYLKCLLTDVFTNVF